MSRSDNLFSDFHQWKVPVSGGLYNLDTYDIMVSIPYEINSESTDLILQSQPLPEDEVSEFGQKSVVSEMITLLPHQASFHQHVLIKFPLQTSKMPSCESLELWHSDGKEGSQREWVKISKHKHSFFSPDDIFWFSDDRHCYVFMKKFCHVVVTKGSLELCVSLHGLWTPEQANTLEITIGFHCRKCNEINLANMVSSIRPA